MSTLRKLDKRDVIELLNKCWMTHDGMWFLLCMQKFGIDTANRLNKEAIASLAPMEVARIKQALGISEKNLKHFKNSKRSLTARRHSASPIS